MRLIIGRRVLARFFCYLFIAISIVCSAHAEDRIKVGVPTALSGDAAALGVDIKNALTLMNERFGNNRYELIFEDERCDNREAVNVAHRLININKVRYALGFPCNSSMLATASIYERSKVLVITSSATSGDVLDVGKHIFRLFPSDIIGAKLLYQYMGKRHKRVGILTEQNEYPVMMDRSLKTENAKTNKPIEMISEEFRHGQPDLRTLLIRLISKKVDAIFVNANTETSFITLVKQLRELKYGGELYAAYLPGSAVVMKELGTDLNGFIYANLPLADNLVTAEGRELLKEFRTRFGEPQSGFSVVPTSFEAFRVFDLAIQSGKAPLEFLSETKFSGGFLPDFYFDEHGAVQGIKFEMQKIVDGKIVILPED